MTVPPRLEERLRQLIELRKKEEEEYGKLLTHLNEIWKFQLPDEKATRFPEIKEALNQIWDISNTAFSAAQAEDRTFWKEVAASFQQYLEPLVKDQREVNSVLVHLLNEYIDAVHSSLRQIREFQEILILFFLRIVPVTDTKFREMVGAAEGFQIGLRDYMDLLYQQLDRKIEAIRLELAQKAREDDAK
jgi:hypothetical protein